MQPERPVPAGDLPVLNVPASAAARRAADDRTHDRLTELSEEVRRPFPASRRIYVEGRQPGVRVPMRLITQSLTGDEPNPAFPVYDASHLRPART